MTTFHTFSEFNKYLHLDLPKNEDIDIGRYSPEIRKKSGTIDLDFYRVSLKINFQFPLEKGFSQLHDEPATSIFFSSPGELQGWELQNVYDGFYLHLSKKIINKNRHLYRNFLDYGGHEPLFLTAKEEMEILTIFRTLQNSYSKNSDKDEVFLSYTLVLFSLIEKFYARQFSSKRKLINPIVVNFQNMLSKYYQNEVDELPTVKFFADHLQVSPNYLGDVVRHITEKSAIETIHDFVIDKAKEMLSHKNLSIKEIAYALGFSSPNYFSKFLKQHTGFTPKKLQLSITNQ